jgi:MFS family permease
MWLGIAISRLIISPGIKAASSWKICIGNLISAIVFTAGILSGSTMAVIAVTFAVGLTSGLTIPLILATGCEWHREKTAFGAMMPFTAISIGYMMFPPFSGLLSDTFGMLWGIAVCSLGAFLTAIVAGILDKHLKSGR